MRKNEPSVHFEFYVGFFCITVPVNYFDHLLMCDCGLNLNFQIVFFSLSFHVCCFICAIEKLK